MELEKVLADIKRLQDAEKLLEKIWMEYGPYGHGEISDLTRNELQRFFKFDDSE